MSKKPERSPSAAAPQRVHAVTPRPLIIDLQERPLQSWPEPRPPRRKTKAYAKWAERARHFIASQVDGRVRQLETDAVDVKLWEDFVLPNLRRHPELVPWLAVLRTFLPGFSRWHLARASISVKEEEPAKKEQREALDELSRAGVDLGKFLGMLSQTSYSIEAAWVQWVVSEARAAGIVPPTRRRKGEDRAPRAAPKRAWESILATTQKLAAMPIGREAQREVGLLARKPEAVKALLGVLGSYANVSHNPALNAAIVETFRFMETSGLSANRRFAIIGALLGLPPDAVRERHTRHVSSVSGAR